MREGGGDEHVGRYTTVLHQSHKKGSGALFRRLQQNAALADQRLASLLAAHAALQLGGRRRIAQLLLGVGHRAAAASGAVAAAVAAVAAAALGGFRWRSGGLLQAVLVAADVARVQRLPCQGRAAAIGPSCGGTGGAGACAGIRHAASRSGRRHAASV